MKEFLGCDDITYYNKIVAEHSNIQLGHYNEYKLENKIKERRLQSLGQVQDFLMYSILLKLG